MKAKRLRASLGFFAILMLSSTITGTMPAQAQFICQECFTLLDCIPIGDGGFANCFIDEEEICEPIFNPISGLTEVICFTEYTCTNTEFCGTYEEPPGCV